MVNGPYGLFMCVELGWKGNELNYKKKLTLIVSVYYTYFSLDMWIKWAIVRTRSNDELVFGATIFF